jgi:hypothetical protein
MKSAGQEITSESNEVKDRTIIVRAGAPNVLASANSTLLLPKTAGHDDDCFQPTNARIMNNGNAKRLSPFQIISHLCCSSYLFINLILSPKSNIIDNSESVMHPEDFVLVLL